MSDASTIGLFSRVSRDNGQWSDLLNQWESECGKFEENFDEYAPATIDVLRPLAEETQIAHSGVYAFSKESDYMAMCQLNVAYLPGYPGKVLRVRHILYSPRFDFDAALAIEDYAAVLTGVFIGVLRSSDTDMLARHIKFHFRSPAEREFYSVLKEHLKDTSVFEHIDLRGAWLYITKVN